VDARFDTNGLLEGDGKMAAVAGDRATPPRFVELNSG